MRKFTRKLLTFSAALRNDLAPVLHVGGSRIATAAQISITTNSASGIVTEKHKHVPSAPGEAPNNFSGDLAGNIEVLQPAPDHVQVISQMPYSEALERGTSRMAARPFMEPALERERAGIDRLIRQATRRTINRHFRS